MEFLAKPETLKTAAVVTIAVMLASNLTSTSSSLVKGGAMFGAALAGLFIATKV